MPFNARGDAPPPRVPGLQLYTLRDAMADDVEATLQAVAGIGYREVEFAGYHGRSPAEVRSLLERYGLAAPSAHVNPVEARSDPVAAAVADVRGAGGLHSRRDRLAAAGDAHDGG